MLLYVLLGIVAYSLCAYLVSYAIHRYRQRGLSEEDYQYLKYMP